MIELPSRIWEKGKSNHLLDNWIIRGLKYLDRDSFYNCNNLKSVYIEAEDCSLDSNVACFVNCNNLKQVYMIVKPIYEYNINFYLDHNIETIMSNIYLSSEYDFMTLPQNIILDDLGDVINFDKNIKNKNIYVNVEKKETDIYWSENFRNNNNLYYKGEWNLALFFSNDMLIKIVPVPKNNVMNIPSETEIYDYLPTGAEFKGWDINNDGKTDKIPSTISSNIVAKAIYELPIESVEIGYDYCSYSTDPEDWNEIIDKRYIDIEEGDERQLDYTILPYDYTGNDKIIWTTSDESKLTVNQSGRIFALATEPDLEETEVVIRASLEDNPDIYCDLIVNVVPKYYGIEMEETEIEIPVGQKKVLSPKYFMPEGTTYTPIFLSDNESVAKIDSNGLLKVTGVGKAIITVKILIEGWQEYESTLTIYGIKPLESVVLTEYSSQINIDESIKIEPILNPIDTTDSKTIDWFSDDSSIAEVSSDGVVIGVSPGKTIIFGSIGDFSLEFDVTVKAPITKIVLNTTKGTLRLDHTKQLEVLYYPSNTTDDKSVVWSTGDPEIATVDENGLVTGLKRGTTVITATVNQGTENEQSATYTVTVIGLRDPETGITVTNSDDTAMDEDTSLTVEEIDNNEANEDEQYANMMNNIIFLVRDKHGRLILIYMYDITLWRNLGIIQPDRTVDVDIPLPYGKFVSGSRVYRMETDGSLTDMNAYYANGCFRFQTEHFSNYCLAIPVDEEDYEKVTHNHVLSHIEGFAATDTESGIKEHWYCVLCDRYFSDENAEAEIPKTDTIIRPLNGIITFNPSTNNCGAIIHGLEDGEVVNGVKTFTVECEQPCIVAYLAEGEEEYVVLEAKETDDANVYEFSLDVQGSISIAIVKKGDANLDGKVDSGDALQVLRYDVGKANLNSLQLLAVDLNRDNKVNSGDALQILRRDVGKASFNW